MDHYLLEFGEITRYRADKFQPRQNELYRHPLPQQLKSVSDYSATQ